MNKSCLSTLIVPFNESVLVSRLYFPLHIRTVFVREAILLYFGVVVCGDRRGDKACR